MIDKRIVYVSFGGAKFEDQTRYSVLLLLHLLEQQQRHDYRIVVYADQPARVPQHPFVTAVLLTREQLAEWSGPLENVHRIRLEILHRAVGSFGLPLLYVDSDTRWLALPDAPFEDLHMGAAPGGAAPFYMHVCEGDVSAQFHPRYFDHLQRHPQQLSRLNLPVTGPWTMWNAGVIGVPKGADDFFAHVMQLLDVWLPHVKPRNFADQLIISLEAGRRGELRGLQPWLHHYWQFSQEAPVFLRNFFLTLSSSLPVKVQAQRCAEHHWDEATMEHIRQAKASDLRRRWAKLQHSLRKRRIDTKALWLSLLARAHGWP